MDVVGIILQVVAVAGIGLLSLLVVAIHKRMDDHHALIRDIYTHLLGKPTDTERCGGCG